MERVALAVVVAKIDNSYQTAATRRRRHGRGSSAGHGSGNENRNYTLPPLPPSSNVAQIREGGDLDYENNRTTRRRETQIQNDRTEGNYMGDPNGRPPARNPVFNPVRGAGLEDNRGRRSSILSSRGEGFNGINSPRPRPALLRHAGSNSDAVDRAEGRSRFSSSPSRRRDRNSGAAEDGEDEGSGRRVNRNSGAVRDQIYHSNNRRRTASVLFGDDAEDRDRNWFPVRGISSLHRNIHHTRRLNVISSSFPEEEDRRLTVVPSSLPEEEEMEEEFRFTVVPSSFPEEEEMEEEFLAMQPADRAAVLALPRIKISENDGHVNENCPICFDAFQLGEKASQIQCNHTFHKKCITPWFKFRSTCPVCRFQLPLSHSNI